MAGRFFVQDGVNLIKSSSISILVKTKYHKNSIKRPHTNKCPSPNLDAPNGHLSVSFGIPEKIKCDVFAQNIDCGFTKEVLRSTNNLCFG